MHRSSYSTQQNTHSSSWKRELKCVDYFSYQILFLRLFKDHETILFDASRRIYVGGFVGGRQKDREGFDDAAKSAKVESVDKDDGTEKTF